MKIYIAHSSSFDYRKELYEPLKNSNLNEKHEIVLPHEQTDEQFNSKKYLKECDLVLAEVSYSSIGQGIELGWADIYKVPIVCFHKRGGKVSGALKIISKDFIEYHDSKDMVKKLSKYLKMFVLGKRREKITLKALKDYKQGKTYKIENIDEFVNNL